MTTAPGPQPSSSLGRLPVAGLARPDGWYPDPLHPTGHRYWRDKAWTYWTSRTPTAEEAAHAAQDLAQLRRKLGLTPSRQAEASTITDGQTASGAMPVSASREQQLRPDIAEAKAAMHGSGIGAGKEIRLLVDRLAPEERVLALASAIGPRTSGIGVLACTSNRLLFFFKGLVQSEFVEYDWNALKGLRYDAATKTFAVYTVKVTKRAKPVTVLKGVHPKDADRVGMACQHASAAPRLEIA